MQEKKFFFVNKVDSLILFHQNIAGLLGKKDIIETAIEELENRYKQHIDILCFTETFVKSGSMSILNIPNFKVASSYCRKEKRGGSCILIPETYDCSEIKWIADLGCDRDFECCAIKLPCHNLIVVCIYRTPDSDCKIFLSLLSVILQKLSKGKYKNIILCGDWNINLLNTTNPQYKELISILLNFKLSSHINTPTRRKTCIDVIISNISNCKSDIEMLGLSDHETAQILHFQLPIKNKLIKPQIWTEKR